MKAYRIVKIITEGVVAIENINEPPFKMSAKLRDGCIGLQLIFKTKKAARKFGGKNVELEEIIVDSVEEKN